MYYFEITHSPHWDGILHNIKTFLNLNYLINFLDKWRLKIIDKLMEIY